MSTKRTQAEEAERARVAIAVLDSPTGPSLQESAKVLLTQALEALTDKNKEVA